jgi:hypothetical protein
MITCNEATETEPKPGMMQSIEEHQEIPKEDAAVMPVRGPRKLHRVCNLATECCQKMRERTRGNSGSRRKSAAACRKVSRNAKVAWGKRNLIRKIQTLEKCGQRMEFAAARIRINRCAKVARCKGCGYEGPSVEQGQRNNKTRNTIARGTQIEWLLGRRQLMHQGGPNGTRN